MWTLLLCLLLHTANSDYTYGPASAAPVTTPAGQSSLAVTTPAGQSSIACNSVVHVPPFQAATVRFDTRQRGTDTDECTFVLEGPGDAPGLEVVVELHGMHTRAVRQAGGDTTTLKPQGLGLQSLGTQGLRPQGFLPQGLEFQDLVPQSLGTHGLGPQGLGTQGLGTQGLGPQGLEPQESGTQAPCNQAVRLYTITTAGDIELEHLYCAGMNNTSPVRTGSNIAVMTSTLTDGWFQAEVTIANPGSQIIKFPPDSNTTVLWEPLQQLVAPTPEGQLPPLGPATATNGSHLPSGAFFPMPPELGVPEQGLQPELGVPAQGLQPELGVPEQGLQPELGVPAQGLQPELGVPAQGVQPELGVPAQGLQSELGVPTQGLQTAPPSTGPASSTRLPPLGTLSPVPLYLMGSPTPSSPAAAALEIQTDAPAEPSTVTSVSERRISTVEYHTTSTEPISPEGEDFDSEDQPSQDIFQRLAPEIHESTDEIPGSCQHYVEPNAAASRNEDVVVQPLLNDIENPKLPFLKGTLKSALHDPIATMMLSSAVRLTLGDEDLSEESTHIIEHKSGNGSLCKYENKASLGNMSTSSTLISPSAPMEEPSSEGNELGSFYDSKDIVNDYNVFLDSDSDGEAVLEEISAEDEADGNNRNGNYFGATDQLANIPSDEKSFPKNVSYRRIFKPEDVYLSYKNMLGLQLANLRKGDRIRRQSGDKLVNGDPKIPNATLPFKNQNEGVTSSNGINNDGTLPYPSNVQSTGWIPNEKEFYEQFPYKESAQNVSGVDLTYSPGMSVPANTKVEMSTATNQGTDAAPTPYPSQNFTLTIPVTGTSGSPPSSSEFAKANTTANNIDITLKETNETKINMTGRPQNKTDSDEGKETPATMTTKPGKANKTNTDTSKEETTIATTKPDNGTNVKEKEKPLVTTTKRPDNANKTNTDKDKGEAATTIPAPDKVTDVQEPQRATTTTKKPDNGINLGENKVEGTDVTTPEREENEITDSTNVPGTANETDTDGNKGDPTNSLTDGPGMKNITVKEKEEGITTNIPEYLGNTTDGGVDELVKENPGTAPYPLGVQNVSNVEFTTQKALATANRGRYQDFLRIQCRKNSSPPSADDLGREQYLRTPAQRFILHFV